MAQQYTCFYSANRQSILFTWLMDNGSKIKYRFIFLYCILIEKFTFAFVKLLFTKSFEMLYLILNKIKMNELKKNAWIKHE